MRPSARYFFLLCSFHFIALSQNIPKDTLHNLDEITITTYKEMNGIGRMNDQADGIIYAGKKNEVLAIDNLEANKAINNTRQIIGRIPGANIIETESGGFTANGIGFRGLNPYQSIETNTHQNGYGVSADIFGYNEAYYLPPMEAVKNITFVRGASALAFGPQIGGMINYELKDGAKKPFEFTTSQSAGSFGMMNSYNSIGGTYKKIKYFSFVQYRNLDGWRKNSDQKQISGFGSIKYNVCSKLQIGLEYSLLRNKIHMPGGLTDSTFNADPKQSGRSRNWLESPWNILAAHLNYKINDNTTLTFKSSYLFSERNLIWRNEDGGPDALDSITPGLTYVPRELEREYFKSTTNELRFLTNYNLGSQKQTLAFGVRYAYSWLKRQEGAEGTTGTGFDLTQVTPWPVYMNFYTSNAAAFVENTFRLGKRFSITPGVRYEYLSTIADGYSENEAGDSENELVISKMQKSTRKFLLGGLGMQFNTSATTNFYANYSQSYKPITYSDLTPFGTIAKIDPNLKDASGDNVDVGYRGSIKNILNFDAGFFYLNYKNKVSTIERTNDTITYLFRTNVGSAEHKGIETYLELNILDGLIKTERLGKLSIYNSFAYVNARYISGDYVGKFVEYAPKYIERCGLTYNIKKFSCNLQYSYNDVAYGDPSNTKFSSDGLIGIIPSYSLIDLSASYKIKNYQFKFGVNNLNDAKYFTLRTGEYPGPGIIPSIGRMIYGGISATF
jgi:Fe(3+) dicitrate transport protein